MFVTVFATVIAITKDLADIQGDRQFRIDTFATRLGPERLAFCGVPSSTGPARPSPLFSSLTRMCSI